MERKILNYSEEIRETLQNCSSDQSFSDSFIVRPLRDSEPQADHSPNFSSSDTGVQQTTPDYLLAGSSNLNTQPKSSTPINKATRRLFQPSDIDEYLDDSFDGSDYVPSSDDEVGSINDQHSSDDETEELFVSLLDQSIHRNNTTLEESFEPLPPPKQKKEWAKVTAKKMRQRGLEYIGTTVFQDKRVKVLKPAKVRRPKCQNPACARYGKGCDRFSDENLEHIKNNYYSLTDHQKKEFIRSAVLRQPPKRRRVQAEEDEPFKRNNTFIYRLRIRDEWVPICKQLFLNTLVISQTVVKTAFQKLNACGMAISVPRAPRQESEIYLERFNFLETWMDSFPKMESHYCRKNTSKIYFDTTIFTKTQLYKLYAEKSDERNIKPFSFNKFLTYIKEKNYSVYKPKKDKCDTCAQHEKVGLPSMMYEAHIERKKIARKEKTLDKKRTENDTMVYTVDVQSQLMLPLLNNSEYYYKSKLVLHNFTVFNLKNKDVCNFLWTENEGGTDASVFSTLYRRMVQKALIENPHCKRIIIWSDGCGYQNRSKVLSQALLMIANEYKIEIIQKYLEVSSV